MDGRHHQSLALGNMRANATTMNGALPHSSVCFKTCTTEQTPLLSMGATQSHSPRRTSLLGIAAVGICSAVAVATQSITSLEAASVLASSPLPSSSDPRDALRQIYCEGPLLDAMQRASLFNDSKYFVDMPLKPQSSPQQVLIDFRLEIEPVVANAASPASIQDTLRAFLAKHFDDAGSDLQPTVPPDFSLTPTPPLIASIKNQAYREWAIALHSLWKELGRSPRRDVQSSYLQPTPVPALGDNTTSTLIVVPGGRFRESYYWDSYWIVKGLLVSNMHETARRVVQNLLEYVAEFGFVPNGGRLYYLNRSQPPMLSDMVRLAASTRDTEPRGWDVEYLRKVVPILVREYKYWMATHKITVQVNGVDYALNHYTTNSTMPRPESYREDVHLAEASFPSDVARQGAFYSDIIAAAESGWDFSSRWFDDHEHLSTIVTRQMIPVDLNAILHRVESNLAEFYRVLGENEASDRFKTAASRRARAIDVVLWDEASHSWRDFDLLSQAHSPIISVSNFFPLWTGIVSANDNRVYRVVESLKASGVIQVAGIQTTTTATGQQWDAPNAWPPLQDILIEGLLQAGSSDATALAKSLVWTWINTSFAAWKSTGLMFEKYNATVVGGLGTGGEYTPQFGFGWTNGVVLKFLTEYQDLLA